MISQDPVAAEKLSPVAVIEPVGGHAGMNHYDIELARGLHHCGVHIRLYTCDETTEVDEPGITILKPFKRLYGHGFKMARGIKFLGGLGWAACDARRFRVKVAHLHYFQYGLRELACCIVLKALGIKVVATAHDIKPFSQPEGLSMFKTVVRLTDQVIVHNKFSARMLCREAGFDAVMPPVSVVPMGNFLASATPIERSEARSILSLSDTEPVVLFFGQLKPEKGLDDLLKAFATHKREGGKGFLLVAGRTMAYAREDYVRLAEELCLSKDVRFDLRYIPDEEVSAYYSAADLVVLPYKEIYQSAVLLMAMSYGRAVLGSDLPAMREVIKAGETGLMFKSGDLTSLVNALASALQDRKFLDELGRNALIEMQQHYNWNDFGARTLDIYLQALGQNGP